MRAHARQGAIEGRSDNIMESPTCDGGKVAVHPIEFGIVTRDRAVRELEVVQEPSGVRVLVVARPGADAGLDARLRATPMLAPPRRFSAKVVPAAHCLLSSG